MNLTGKYFLITGGAVRVGAAIARRLAREGMIPIIHYRNSQKEAELLAKELNGLTFYADFSLPPQANQAEELLAQLPPVSVLINNASLYLQGSESQIMSVNFLWPQALTQALAQTRTDSIGFVINMLDSCILQSNMENTYEQSKFLLREYTLSSALNFARNLRVNAVALGPVLPPEELKHLNMAKTKQLLPTGQPIELDDVVEAVYFMITRGSITGAILDVDSGMRLRNAAN